MKPEEISALVQGMAPVVREYVSKGVEPVSAQIAALEKRIDAQQTPTPSDVDAAAIAKEATENLLGEFVSAIAMRFAYDLME